MKTFPRRIRPGSILALVPFFSSASSSFANTGAEPGTSLAGHLLSILPMPEAAILFPFIGLIVAISVTQLLRRRKIAQFRSTSSSGH